MDDLTIDVQYGVVSINTYPIADANGNLQWVTQVFNNGEVTEHRPLRIFYHD